MRPVKNKNKTSFVCQECGYDSPKFMGKCPECGAWNSLKEFQISNLKSQISNKRAGEPIVPKSLSEVEIGAKGNTKRMLTGFSEMDTVLGGGLVPGSVTLLAGDPGIGKSTLLLQVALNISSQKTQNTQKFGQSDSQSFPSIPNKVLYISGEESEEQIKLRAERLVHAKNNSNLLLVALSDPDVAVEIIEKTKPTLVIIDSIQMMESEHLEGLAGAVGQVRYATFAFMQTAKQLSIPIILVGHVTKEGMVAGPMVLSHMVDTVLFLEGEKFTRTRLLRSLKNRFGPVDEVGVFSMEGEGMNEVKNPETIFIGDPSAGSGQAEKTPGAVLAVTLEGTRAFLVEVQSLVVFSKLPYPRRVATGIDPKRLELLLAVLQKHCGVPLDTMDVFVNVVGGIKITDPGIDLAICLAIFSSFKNVSLNKTVGIGEVGLLGELRGIGGLEKRIKQAEKLGLKSIITSKTNKRISEILKEVSSN